ncbi:MAG TPA: MFS transporter [Gaiellaceae bacterium]
MILAAGTLAQASFSMTSVALPALAPALRVHYGLSLRQVGVVLAAVGVGMLLTLLPWGLLADRLDERWVIAMGLAGCAVALAGAGLTHSFASVTLVLVVAGALGASVNAASGRAVMSWFPAAELGLALGIRQTAIPIGGAVGAALLPVLAAHGGTRLAFFVLGASTVVGAVLAAAFIRGSAPGDSVVAELGRPLREPMLWLLAGGTSLYLTAQIGITGFIVLFLHEHRHVSTHAAAGLLALINVLAIGTRIGSGRISDRVGDRVRPLRVIGVACAAATAVVAASTDGPLPLLLPAFVIAGALSMSWNALGFAAAAETVGSGKTGAALGFQQTILGVVVAVAPPAFAALASSSWRLAYALAAAGPLVGALLLLRLSPRSVRSRGRSVTPPAAP